MTSSTCSVKSIKVVGAIGVNLLSTKAGIGAFVDSFYRSEAGHVLPAEASKVVEIGDLIVAVNGFNTRTLSLSQISQKIRDLLSGGGAGGGAGGKGPGSVRTRALHIDFEAPMHMHRSMAEMTRDRRIARWLLGQMVKIFHPDEGRMRAAELIIFIEFQNIFKNQWPHSGAVLPDVSTIRIQHLRHVLAEPTVLGIIEQLLQGRVHNPFTGGNQAVAFQSIVDVIDALLPRIENTLRALDEARVLRKMDAYFGAYIAASPPVTMREIMGSASCTAMFLLFSTRCGRCVGANMLIAVASIPIKLTSSPPPHAINHPIIRPLTTLCHLPSPLPLVPLGVFAGATS